MTHKPPLKLLSPNACVKIGQWNVRTLFETCKCAQAIKETRRYGFSILGVSEMRWNSCGRLRTELQEKLCCVQEWMKVKIIREELASFCLKKLRNACWNRNRYLRGYSEPRSTRGGSRSPSCNAMPQQMRKRRRGRTISMVLEQLPCRDVKIIMEDMNAKVGMDHRVREEVMGAWDKN